MEFEFVNPWLLYFLGFPPLLWLWWRTAYSARERRLGLFVSPEMQRKMRPAHSRIKALLQSICLCLALFLALVAAARPRWGAEDEIVFRKGRDLVIALDVSRSMLANDVHPNRLERAKADIMDLIMELRGDRAALVAFRRGSVLLCPLTTDYGFLKHALDGVDIHSAPRGETDIASAITKAMESFQADEGSHKAILLISDGEDLTGRAAAAARTAAERGIPIFTVGIGSRFGAGIPDPESESGYMQYDNQDVVTRLSHDTLMSIANITGGAYIPVETAGIAGTTLGTLYRKHLRNIAARDIEESRLRRHVERYQLFLLPAVLLMIAGAFLSRGRLAGRRAGRRGNSPAAPVKDTAAKTGLRDINPPKRHARVIAALAIAFSGPLAAYPDQEGTADSPTPAGETRSSMSQEEVKQAVPVPPGRDGARIAQRLYGLREYEEAAKAYTDAAAGAAGRSQTDFRHNAAVSYFKAGMFAEAADVWRGLVLSTARPESRFAAGLGAALYRQAGQASDETASGASEKARLLAEAGEAFRLAAQLDQPNSGENLAVASAKWESAMERASLLEVIEKYGEMPPHDIIDRMMRGQREIVENAPAAFKQRTPEKIRRLEALSKQQKEIANLWIPLSDHMRQGLEDAPPDVAERLDGASRQARQNMLDASGRLRDLDPSGVDGAALAGNSVYNLWKSVAPHEYLLRESILFQTNSITLNTPGMPFERLDTRAMTRNQQESLELANLFKERFKSSAAPVQLPVEDQAGLGAEDREKILMLAGLAIAAQDDALDMITRREADGASERQRDAYDILKQIEDMLKSAQEQIAPDEMADKPEPQEQEDSTEQPEEQDDSRPDDDAAMDVEPPEMEDPQPDTGEDEEEREDLPDDVSDILERALQRERDHQAERRRRDSAIPMAPVGRDW